MGLLNYDLTNPQTSIEWMIYLTGKYLKMFLDGTWLTLYIAVLGTIFGFILGYIVGIVQDMKTGIGDNPVKKTLVRILKVIAAAYVEVFRDTPMGAYMAETVRGGIGSIDLGQREGAWAMGMSPMKTMIYIVLPQAFKNIIPEMANTFLTNLKMTSVLNVIAVQELFMAAKTVGGNYYKYFESYLVIAVIYFVLCFVFNKIFNFMEKKLKGKKDYALAVEYMDNQ